MVGGVEMIFALATLLTKFGLPFERAKSIAKWAVVICGIVIALFLVFSLRSCFNRPPKLDQKAIEKAQQAIAKEDRKEMIEVLADSAVKEQGIDNSIKLA